MMGSSHFREVYNSGTGGEEGKKEIRLFGLASSGKLLESFFYRWLPKLKIPESMTTLLKFFGERGKLSTPEGHHQDIKLMQDKLLFWVSCFILRVAILNGLNSGLEAKKKSKDVCR